MAMAYTSSGTGHPRLLELVQQDPMAALLFIYKNTNLNRLRDRIDYWAVLACRSIGLQDTGADEEWLDIFQEQLQRLAEAQYILLLHQLQLNGMPGAGEPEYCWLINEEIQDPLSVIIEFRYCYAQPRAVSMTWYWLETLLVGGRSLGIPASPDLFRDFEWIMVLVAAAYK